MWVKGTPLDTPECAYFRQKAFAATAQSTIQNYSYWLNETRNVTSSFSNVDWIICDEAHELDQILMAAGVEEFRYPDLNEVGIPRPRVNMTIDELIDWGNDNQHTVKDRLTLLRQRARALGLNLHGDGEDVEGEIEDIDDEDPDGPDAEALSHDDKVDALVKAYHVAKRVDHGISVLISLSDEEKDEWVIDFAKNGGALLLKPIYGKHAFKRILAAAHEKIVLMSAFLGPELLMKTLGIDEDDVEIIRAPEAFDRSKSRIYYCPVRKFTFKTTTNEWRYLMNVIDRFMSLYATDKGMIHAPSVRLRNQVVDGITGVSAKQRFLAYDADGPSRRFPPKDAVLDTFTRSKLPNVLVGQSISTGVDLPHVPKWQIIPKLWFLPTDDPAVVKRKEVDKNFYPYHTICQLVQAAGRIKRAPDHDGPTIILDETFGWFFQSQKDHFPMWFRKALIYKGWDFFPDIKAALPQIAFRSGILLRA
jgi:Rad3-related DNA helicase